MTDTQTVMYTYLKDRHFPGLEQYMTHLDQPLQGRIIKF